MSKFKAKRRDQYCIELIEWIPEQKASKVQLYHNPDQKIIPGHWSKEVKYYGKWSELAYAAINRKIVVVGKELTEQLKSLPDAMKLAAEELKKCLKVDNSKALDLLLRKHTKDLDSKLKSEVESVIGGMIEEIKKDMEK